MRRLSTFVLCATALILSSAHAQLIGDPRCKDQQFTAGEVEKINKSIEIIVNAVEEVPPDEAAYMHSEMQKALAQSNRIRFNAVAKRHSFEPLQFHDDANVLVENLKAARTASGRDLARYLIVALSKIGDLQVTMDQYISADMRRHPSTLTQDNRDTMYFQLPLAKGKTISLLQCVVSVL